MSTSEPEMRILESANCKSTSGRSTLSYQIGVLPDSTVHIRITQNTGAGFFNNDWIKIDDIHKALAKGHKGDPLTSFLLSGLFKGRSSNSPAFLMAALTNERLVRVLKGKKRGNELLDPQDFDAKMAKLVSAKVSPNGTSTSTRKKAVTKKAPSKKAAVKKRIARRKQEKVS
jgi:hypothetical protein